MTDKRQWTAQFALEWAFRREKAQLELPDLRPVEERGQGVGIEHVLLQQIELGTRVDKSTGRSLVHHDADVIAAIVGGHPVRHLAIRMAECARFGVTPDWKPGAEPKIEPVERTGFGRAKTDRGDVWVEKIVERVTPKRSRGRPRHGEVKDKRVRRVRYVTHETVMCPIKCINPPYAIKAARRDYENWWKALNMVREHLQKTDMLSTIIITDGMPPRRPWEKKPDRKDVA